MSQQANQSVHLENLAEIYRLSNDVADEIKENIHKVLVTEDINFTGGLDKSFYKQDENGFVIIASDSPYALPVDRGMPQGTIVNFDKLLVWVMGKLGISDEDEAREVTFKIRNKIINSGIKPTRFIKKAVRMFIMKHGDITPNRKGSSQKLSKWQKRLKKAMKYIKKIYRAYKKVLRKFNKGLNKTSKFLNTVKRMSN